MNEHWEPVIPYVYRRGALIERDSGDCGRWVNFDPSVDWVCEQCTKYYKQKYEVTQDGITWVDSGLRRRGAVYEYDSDDCCIYRWYTIPISEGYVCDDCGPRPTGFKWIAKSYNGFIESAACDSTSAITANEPFGNSSFYSSITIGDCVTSIGSNAFSNFNFIKSVGPVGSGASVEIPSGVTSIGNSAFPGCRDLTSMTIPDSVGWFGIVPGAYPSLRDLTVGGSLTITFSWEQTINSSLKNIRVNGERMSGSFQTNAIESITFGSNFNYFSDRALYGLNNSTVTGLTFESTTPPEFGGRYPLDSPVRFPIFVPCESINAYKKRFSSDADKVTCTNYYRRRDVSGDTYCSGITKYIDVYSQESFDEGNTWETTATTAQVVENFSTSCGCLKTTTAITYEAPSQISTGSGAFVPDAIDHYFSNGVGVFEFASDVISFNSNVFSGKNITSIYLPDSISEIGVDAFESSHIRSIHLPNQLTSIGDGAFQGCSLTSITIPDSVTEIGESVFLACSLTSIGPKGSGAAVEIPDSVTSIRGTAFAGCSLTSITIPDSVISIGDYAFQKCRSLTSAIIGSGIIHIGMRAFQNCSSLTSCTIGSGITYFGSEVFQGCDLLSRIIFEGTTPPRLGYNAFDYTDCPIYVPNESVDLYKTAFCGYSGRILPIRDIS